MLKLNVVKMKCIFFSKSPDAVASLPQTLTTSDGKLRISNVLSFKLLGVYVDPQLNWKVHIDHFDEKACEITGNT